MVPVPSEALLFLADLRAGLPDAEPRLLQLVSGELRNLIGWHLRGEPQPRLAQDSALAHQAYRRRCGPRLCRLATNPAPCSAFCTQV